MDANTILTGVTVPSFNTLCNDAFWNRTTSWDTSDPILSRCFIQLVLRTLPCLVFLFPLSWKLLTVREERIDKSIRGSYLGTVRVYLSVIATSGALIETASMWMQNVSTTSFEWSFLLWSSDTQKSMKPIGDLLTSVVVTITMIVLSRLLIAQINVQRPPSASVWLFSLVMSICSSIHVYHAIYRDILPYSQVEKVTSSTQLGVMVLLLIACSFSDQEYSTKNPKKYASFPSRISFWWANQLHYKGYDGSLTFDDMLDVTEEKSMSHVNSIFQKNISKGKPFGAISLMFKMFKWSILIAASIEFVNEIFTIFRPYLIKWLLHFIETKDEPFFHGIFIIVLLFLSSFVSRIMTDLVQEITNKIDYQYSNGLTNLVFQKALRLKKSEMKEMSSGKIISIMSGDTNQLTNVMWYLVWYGTIPFRLVASVYFIYAELGMAAFVGLGAKILFAPINWYVMKNGESMEEKNSKLRDQRVKIMKEVVSGISVIKLYAWEESIIKRVLKLRKEEIKQMKHEMYFQGLLNFFWGFSDFFMTLAAITAYVYLDDRNVLTPQKVFVIFTYLHMVPLWFVTPLIKVIIRVRSASKRVNELLNAPEAVDYVERRWSQGPAVQVSNGNFSWETVNDASEAKLTLKDINMTVEKGSLVAVVGVVGSGKSSLLSALLCEMEKVSGDVVICGDINNTAFAPQQAWIQNMTLKDNIVFGKKFDKQKYDKVIDACQLKPDIELFPAGDETEIGEKGINLSGGQKQRVSLARACYFNSSLYLLDDPLSAVDSHVGKCLFDKVISSKTGILRNKTRILVTNHLWVLPYVDQIIVMNNGTITESGSYQSLIRSNGNFSEFIQNFSTQNGHISSTPSPSPSTERIPLLERTISSISGSSCIGDSREQTISHDKLDENENPQRQKKGRLIEDEELESGEVKSTTYLEYLKNIRYYWLVALLVTKITAEVLATGGDYWLSLWSEDKPLVRNGTAIQDMQQTSYRLKFYGLSGLLKEIVVFISSMCLLHASFGASEKIHTNLLNRVLRAPITTFFNRTPGGRIIKRFTRDQRMIDRVIPRGFKSVISCIFQILSTIIMITTVTPWFLMIVVPLALFYSYIQKYYIPTARQLKRLEATSDAPVYSHFSESISGVSTIRAFRVADRFTQELDKRMDKNERYDSTIRASENWLSFRLAACGYTVEMFAALLAVLSRDTLSPSMVALSLSYARQISGSLGHMIHVTRSLELNLISIERILQYCKINTEAEWNIPSVNLSPHWPDVGRISFENISCRYRPELDLAIKSINVSVDACDRIGVVGRTGAGKTTITLSLFRLIEAAEGKIIIDGVDISKIGLHQLRKKLTIIPQDPVLFSGSLRFNLDPLNEKTDEELWSCLKDAHLKSFVSTLKDGLEYEITEGGDNLSVGQRQLVCLARALLRKTKILILDEATASVDMETDSLIQKTIREKFADCTVITIAHRLHTILDSTKVLVLDQGRVVEYDNPKKLLANKQSFFYSLAKNAGIA